MKKLVAFALSAVMVLSLAACQTGGSSTSVNAEYKKEISDAAKKLNDTYTNYVISTTTESDWGASEYIECVKGTDIYTEYSVDEEGNVGTISYGSADTVSYAMIDWTHDGKFYSFASDDAGNSLTYQFPSNFATKYNNDREMLWVNRLLAGATEIKPYDDLTLTLGGVEQTFKAYEIAVSSKIVEEILGYDTWGVYSSLKDDEKSGTNMYKFCEYYLQDIERFTAYSDSRVIVAIDENGILKFMMLETGGLGSRLYVTKAVVDVSNANVRETPDFSGAVPMASTLTEIADFVAGYPDYDTAMRALSEMSDSSQFDLDSSMSGQDLLDNGEAGTNGDSDGSEGGTEPDDVPDSNQSEE